MRKQLIKGLLLGSCLVISACSSGPAVPLEPEPVQQEEDGAEGVSYQRDTTAGSRIPVTLEEAVLKKNGGEQFILLYTKDDCEYCAAFDEVLNPYLENHHLDIYEVSLTDAEARYTEDDKDAMLAILSAGVSSTPALYWIESPSNVSLLDHTEYNYSEGGLEEWVVSHQLDAVE